MRVNTRLGQFGGGNEYPHPAFTTASKRLSRPGIVVPSNLLLVGVHADSITNTVRA